MKNSSRNIWEQPWGYTEGFILTAGILLTGFFLQLAVGNIEIPLFAAPVNYITGALFITGIILLHLLSGKSRVTRWLSGIYAAIPAVSALLLLCIILGLLPQLPKEIAGNELPPGIFKPLGWYQMTTSWPFILLCFYLLMILGLAILKRTRRKQSLRDIGFYLNHIGLFVALLGGILGSADMERLIMSVNEGQVEWRATDRQGTIKELTIAIQLDSFIIEEYEPKLVIIDNETGIVLPLSRPESYMFEGAGKTALLAGATIEIIEYLPHAAIFRDSAFLNVVPMMMEGAAIAMKIRVDKAGLPCPVEGWVSNGSYLFPPNQLQIDEHTSVAMPLQEVKKYRSHVTVYTEAGHTQKIVIEVNKPLSIGDWTIYQYSYDDSKGKYSDTPIFELVRDPLLKVVYSGIFMLIAGAIFIFIAGPEKSIL